MACTMLLVAYIFQDNIESIFFYINQVGGVHFSLLSKVRYDIGDSCSLDYLIDSIFPLFRKHIEPDLHHAQVGCFLIFMEVAFLFSCLNFTTILFPLPSFARSELTTALCHHLERQSTRLNAEARCLYHL